MTGIAVVASSHDAQFAQDVRAGLQAAGHNVSLSEILPRQAASRVVLIWSAALETGHTIDAQALIGLWSEGRLLVVRRDAATLPLGLRDLPSLPPDNSAADVCAALSKADPSATPVARSRVPAALAALVAIAGMGAAYYYFTAEQRARQAELTARVESASKASEELTTAQAKQLEALKEVEARRQVEASALKSGDAVKIREAQEATRRAEAEAAIQAELVKQRETAAAKARDDAMKAANAAKQAKAKTPASKAPVATVTEAPRVAEAPKAAEPARPVAKAPEKPKAMSRSERERLRDEEAARKALAAAAKAPVQVAAPPFSATELPPMGADADFLYRQALALENEGKAAESIRIYRRAARAGSGKAAKRLGEIFDKGVPGVSRDYAESLQWYETARQLGETVEMASARARAGTVHSEPQIAAPKSAPADETAAAAAKAAARGRSELTYALVLLVVLLAVGVLLWRRYGTRKDPHDIQPAAKAPQPQATRRSGAQPSPDAATLFVSYSHKDKSRVEPIVSLMEAMGRRVWMDRTDITGQAGWAGQIVRAIRECRAVVLMASPNSYSSDQVVRELYLAMNHKKTIVPIEIEPAELPDELQYILAPFQHHRLSGRETRDVLGRALAAV